MASSLADHHHMVKRETIETHSVHIHDEDMEEDETSNPFEGVSSSPVFGHNLRSSSRNLYSIPSISITMSSHHAVKRDVNLSASACLDDLVHGQKRNGHESNGSASTDNGNHSTSISPRHRNLSCLNGRNRHRSSPSTALERYCESPSTFLLDPRLDSRNAVSDFPCGTSDDEEESNHNSLNGGRSNSRLSEATEEILFHSSVLGDGQHSSMLRDVSVVTPTIETVASTLISDRVIVDHDQGVNEVVEIEGNDVVVQTSGRGSSSEVIVSTDDDLDMVSGEDVTVTTTAPSVSMMTVRTCSSSPTTTTMRNVVERGGSILRNQLLHGSTTQLVDVGQDDLFILKEPPLNHYNSNQSFVSSDTPLSSVASMVNSQSSHKSIVATPSMVSVPGLVNSSQQHQQTLQMTIPVTVNSSYSSIANPPPVSSLQSSSKIHDSSNGPGLSSVQASCTTTQPLDFKILPAGLIQLASNLAAVFPSSAIQSKQIAIQLLREDGTSIILPITTVSRAGGQSISGQTMTLSTPMITSPMTKNCSSTNIVSSQSNPSNVISSLTPSKADSSTGTKSSGLKNNRSGSNGLKVVTSQKSNPANVNGNAQVSGQITSTVAANGLQGSILTSTTVIPAQSTVQSSTESERPFKCELCSSTFTRLGNYTRHKKIHSLPTKEDQRFKCEICAKSFIQRCDLARHLHIHRGTEPHRCPQCGKGYIRHSDLVTHQRFHNKEKPFTCPHCSKGFCQRGDLNRHLRSIHLQMKPLLCSHCHKKFAKEETLLRHINAVHRDKILDGR